MEERSNKILCQKYWKVFKESDIQLSHDIPRYMGETDADGRHYLCKKYHDIYERIAFKIFFDSTSSESQEQGRQRLKKFSHDYFRK